MNHFPSHLPKESIKSYKDFTNLRNLILNIHKSESGKKEITATININMLVYLLTHVFFPDPRQIGDYGMSFLTANKTQQHGCNKALFFKKLAGWGAWTYVKHTWV